MQKQNFSSDKIESTPFNFGPRRAKFYNIKDVLDNNDFVLDEELVNAIDKYDVIYRALCGILYNFVPNSGHPGGSISSGRIVQSLILNTMDYDFSDPDKEAADSLTYAAGHKALGLYGAWGL